MIIILKLVSEKWLLMRPTGAYIGLWLGTMCRADKITAGFLSLSALLLDSFTIHMVDDAWAQERV